MNAYELADEFNAENNEWNEDNLRHWGKQSANMLRQQADEIALLRGQIKHLESQVYGGTTK
jgi:hypothetical protein